MNRDWWKSLTNFILNSSDQESFIFLLLHLLLDNSILLVLYLPQFYYYVSQNSLLLVLIYFRLEIFHLAWNRQLLQKLIWPGKFKMLAHDLNFLLSLDFRLCWNLIKIPQSFILRSWTHPPQRMNQKVHQLANPFLLSRCKCFIEKKY